MAPIKKPITLVKSFSPILMFLAVYLVVIFLSTNLLEHFFLNQTSRGNPLLISIAALLYGGLAIALFLFLRRFRRQKTSGEKKGLRGKLSAIFIVIVLITSIPQAYLAFRVAFVSQETLFGEEVLDSVDMGLELAYDYYLGQADRLQVASQLPDLDRLKFDLPETSEALFSRIRTVYPNVEYLGIYKDKVLLLSSGASNLYSQEDNIATQPDGLIPSYGTIDAPSVSVKRTIESDDNLYVILSGRLSPNFGSARELLENSHEKLLQFQTYRNVFLIVLFFFFLFFGLPLLLLMIIGGLLVSDRITHPLTKLSLALASVAEGRYDQNLEVEGEDEIASLTRSFNAMVQEMETSKRRVLLAEKIEAWKDIAQQLAHEIRNPLTPIRLSAERLLKKFHQGDTSTLGLIESSMNKILHEVDRLDGLLVEFHDFARLPQPFFQTIKIQDMVQTTIKNLNSEHIPILWDIDLEDSDNMYADKDQILKVLTILTSNALEALQDEPKVRIQGNRLSMGSKEVYRLAIIDKGKGIPPENHSKIFHPYFTTKPDGTGLGLALVQRIVHEHGGNVWFECPKEGGTKFWIDFPLGKAHG